MAWREDKFYFERTEQLAIEAMNDGDDGFSSILVDENGEIVMEQKNEAFTLKEPTAHDTIELVRRAVKKYPPEFLSQCTVYALMEPCVMCMGALFWGNIGHIKYAVSEETLNGLLPGGLEIHSREFAERSPKPMHSEGCVPERKEAVEIVKTWVRSLGVQV
ncbi:MAG: hypothetical protein K1W40_19540 [Schaedlerella sp.]|uniref:nucleoside deaminase n=1 Tax=Schaedlerella sp. TaxID=2676057 RepID=UPI0026079CEF|nr:deaminase [uncultured Schaedlerella sp.]